MQELRAAVALVAVLAGASAADAQRATERFIPLGQSPGVSGRLSEIATIVAVDVEQRRIDLAGSAGRVSVTLRDATSIWIDTSSASAPPSGRSKTAKSAASQR